MSMKPKKLKLKKTFTPPNRDKGDEFFPNGIFEFNITKMIAFINANPAHFSVEEIEVKRYAIWDAKHFKSNYSGRDQPRPVQRNRRQPSFGTGSPYGFREDFCLPSVS